MVPGTAVTMTAVAATQSRAATTTSEVVRPRMSAVKRRTVRRRPTMPRPAKNGVGSKIRLPRVAGSKRVAGISRGGIRNHIKRGSGSVFRLVGRDGFKVERFLHID